MQWYRVVVAADRSGERRARHAVAYVEAADEAAAREAGLEAARADWQALTHTSMHVDGVPLQGHRIVTCTRMTEDDLHAYAHHRLDFETADRRRLVRGYDLMEDGDAWWVVLGELRRRLGQAEAEVRRLRERLGAEPEVEELSAEDILEAVDLSGR